MHTRLLLFAQLTAALLLMLADVYYGIGHFYYYYYWWFDMATHLLGGLWAGFFCAWVAVSISRSRVFLLTICGVLAIGVLWELFELFVGITHYPEDSLDTIKDIGMDLIGGTTAALLSSALDRLGRRGVILQNIP